MPQPWDTEHPVDERMAAALVAVAVPDLAPVRAKYLDEGWESFVFEVNRRWVFRFPKRKEAETSHDRECVLLPRLADALSLPIPRPKWRSEPTDAYPFRFMGYERIDGTPAIELPLEAVDVAACGDLLGEFLTTMHSFPVDEARSLGVRDLPPDGRLESARRFLLDALDPVKTAVSAPLARRIAKFLEGPMPTTLPAASCLTHDDLCDAHFLVQPRSGRVCGVIDWTDASIGDPAVDFGGVWQWLGEPLFDRALRAYRGPHVDDGLRERARVTAALMGLSALWYGVSGRRPSYVVSGVRSLEHSLHP
jgi:aminoglycoside phosphotransferase (APT) family kinase protein